MNADGTLSFWRWLLVLGPFLGPLVNIPVFMLWVNASSERVIWCLPYAAAMALAYMPLRHKGVS